MKKLNRLNNYSVALCLYLLEGNHLGFEINVPVQDVLLREDLFHYFDYIRYNIGAELGLFEVEQSSNYCSVKVARGREKELGQCLGHYVNALLKDELDCSENVPSWKQDLKLFIDKAKTSGFNLKSYNVAIDDMHVVLYGVIQKMFTLKNLNITNTEYFENFGTRTPEGDVDCGDGSEFHKQLDIRCNVDVAAFISRQNKKNTNSSDKFTNQEDWLYKYICDATGHVSCSIPMMFELIDVDQTKSNTFSNFKSFKQAYYRLNDRYEAKYGVRPLVDKVRNEDLFRITFAKNDRGEKLL